jgi:hypothetical protein
VHTYKQFIRDRRKEEAEKNVIQPPQQNDGMSDWSIGLV